MVWLSVKDSYQRNKTQKGRKHECVKELGRLVFLKLAIQEQAPTETVLAPRGNKSLKGQRNRQQTKPNLTG